MTTLTVREIEKAIADLPLKKFSVLRNWFEKFADAHWDKRIEADIKAGKLDAFAAKAVADYKKGKCTEL